MPARRSLPDHVALADSDRRQVDEILASLRSVLGEHLVGAYLHGSAALGRLRQQSDIDVLAVSARTMTDHQRKRSVDRLLGVSAGDPAAAPLRPVELTVVVATEIRPWIYPPTLDFQYGEWLRERFERGDAAARHSRVDPDVTLLVTMTLLADVTLAGPPAADVFDPVPREDFRKALVAEVEGLVRNVDPDTRNVVLTLARVEKPGLRHRAYQGCSRRVGTRAASPAAPGRACAGSGYLRGC